MQTHKDISIQKKGKQREPEKVRQTDRKLKEKERRQKIKRDEWKGKLKKLRIDKKRGRK